MVLCNSIGVIVHSDQDIESVRTYYGETASRSVRKIPLGPATIYTLKETNNGDPGLYLRLQTSTDSSLHPERLAEMLRDAIEEFCATSPQGYASLKIPFER
jgi:hypothetical protein